MIEVDRIMVEDYNIPVEMMMENAGSALARVAIFHLDDPRKTIGIVVGSGNNGGGGLVAARRLHGWGFNVRVYVPKHIGTFREVPKAQWKRAQSIGVDAVEELPTVVDSREIRVLIDAYLGYGYQSKDDSLSDTVFDFLASHPRLITLDAPSGLDVNTGEMIRKMRPHSTLTIAFPKIGLLKGHPVTTGNLLVCDIGVPIEIFREKLDIDWSSPFSQKSLYTLSKSFGEDQVVPLNVGKSNSTHYWSVSK
ncbi:MAG: NAD(P)H-hydrate epimerase [Candidatus Thorarchaeota archaeon]